MSTKSWDDLLAEGEQLKVMEERVEAEAGNVRWLWGDLALEVAPMGDGPGGVGNGATELLKRFAEELDVSFESLRQYRTVAEKWPIGMRIPMQPWACHQQIMGRDDREELISNPVDVLTGEKMNRWTFRAMQRFLGQKPSPHYVAPPRDADEKADLVRELLDDPEVAALVEERAEDERPDAPPKKAKTLDERYASAIHRLNGVLMELAKLSDEAEEAEAIGPHTELGRLVYERITERKLDAEIRHLLEREAVR